MKKKNLITLLAVLLISCSETISFAGDFISSDPYKNSNYNRSNAATYAYNWAYSFNTSEFYEASQDCTNFASQAVYKGGMSQKTISSYGDITGWRPHSSTWENAHAFRQHWGYVNSSSQKRAYSEKDYSSAAAAVNDWYNIWMKIEPGDIMQYGYSGDTRHSQVVHSVNSSASAFVAQHTGPGRDINLLDYLLQTSYPYISVIEIKK